MYRMTQGVRKAQRKEKEKRGKEKRTSGREFY